MSSKFPAEPDTFFTDHLAAFAGARTNPYAIQVAGQICSDFKLSVNGQRRLNKALSDLPCLDSLDQGLSFGWSMDHVIRNPRVHKVGYEQLTIVITLSECFHESYAAEVFHELAKRKIPASQTKPHIYQWLDLLHFCNGICAVSDFGLAVENLLQLDPYSVTPGSKYSSERCLTPPESVAEGLLALAELSCGQKDTLTMRGGAVIGWIAALAEHFFDLSVVIETREGNQLHKSGSGGAQLSLIYVDRPELVIDGGTMNVLSREVTTVSLSPFSPHIHFLPFGGRVAWETLLPQVFGKAFHDLEHAHSKPMYTAIGSAFRAIEDAKDPSSISPRQGPHASLASAPPAPTAAQLVTTLTAYMSGLQRGQGRIERQFKLSGAEAAKVHLEALQQLRSVCKCIVCAPVSNNLRSVTTDSGKGGMDDAQVGYCMTAIAETIIMIVLMMSRVVLAQPIDPSREGVQLLYKTRTDRMIRTKGQEVSTSSPNSVAALYDNALTAQTSHIARMGVKFFAGGHLPPLGSEMLPLETVAIAHEGMCAFAAEMLSGRGVKKDMKGMIRIINGGFGIGQKSYRVAAWSAHKPGGREGWQWESVQISHLQGIEGGKLWFK